MQFIHLSLEFDFLQWKSLTHSFDSFTFIISHISTTLIRYLSFTFQPLRFSFKSLKNFFQIRVLLIANIHWFHRRFNYYSLQTFFFLPNLRYVCLRLQRIQPKKNKYILWIVKGFSLASHIKPNRATTTLRYIKYMRTTKAEAYFVDFPFSHPTSKSFFFPTFCT